jgi:hypothetical protein
MYVCIQRFPSIARFPIPINHPVDMHTLTDHAMTVRDIDSIRNLRMSQYGREAGKLPRAGIGMSRRYNFQQWHLCLHLAR